MVSEVEILGLPRLELQLIQIAETLSLSAEIAVTKQVKKMANEAISIALSKGVYDTGELVDAITYDVASNSSVVTGVAMAEAEHSVYNELGWGVWGAATHLVRPMYTPKYNFDYRGYPARPFMTPAYLILKQPTVDEIIKQINKDIRRAK